MALPIALIFDMDGLLVDSEPRSDLAMERFLGRRMLDLDLGAAAIPATEVENDRRVVGAPGSELAA